MIHPDTELRFASSGKGYGVFAKADIPKGTIVYVQDELDIKIPLDSPLLERPEYEHLIKRYSYFERGSYIISWDIEKYLNHSCDSNRLTTGYGFEIAIRDIKQDEELTDDYGALNMNYDFQCMCGSHNCRGAINRQDFHRYVDNWDQKIQFAFSTFKSVEQPLLPYVDPDTYKALMKYINTGHTYRSVSFIQSPAP
ncbi:MAG: SET domain-containing protein-lysine N-methyltransferase [Cyanobacteria bacterium P01_E01_bin.6]